jgi:serine protease Do
VLPFLVVALLGGATGGITTRLLDARGAEDASPSPTLRPRARPTAARTSAAPTESAAAADPVVQVVRQVGPAVVNIDILGRPPGGGETPPAFRGRVQHGQGSGFIVNGREGLVVTNSHVIENAQEIKVAMSDGRTFSATVVGKDPVGDIALIRLKGGRGLPEVRFADSDHLQIGQTTVAIGNPLGLQNTVTQGVLSQIGRALDGHIRGVPMEDLIQTDAAINPGNSGGPLIDAQGEVIGMNTAIFSEAQGIGFAVASNTIQAAIESIKSHGRVIRAWIGVTLTDLPPPQGESNGSVPPRGKGTVVAGVREGEAAAQGGLQRGDVITEAGGKPVGDSSDLRKAVRALKPGQTLQLKGKREGAERSWQVKVGEMPPADQMGR